MNLSKVLTIAGKSSMRGCGTANTVPSGCFFVLDKSCYNNSILESKYNLLLAQTIPYSLAQWACKPLVLLLLYSPNQLLTAPCLRSYHLILHIRYLLALLNLLPIVLYRPQYLKLNYYCSWHCCSIKHFHHILDHLELVLRSQSPVKLVHKRPL